MTLFIGGCPKRHTTPRLVYTPAPPPSDTADAAQQDTLVPDALVIEEPQPPVKPLQAAPLELPPPKPVHRAHHASPAEPPEASEPAPEPAPTVEVPALEPRAPGGQELARRGQIQQLQSDVQQRLAQLEQVNLAAADHKTLEDARTFLAQSRKALEQSDLERSYTLARKALLLALALAGER